MDDAGFVLGTICVIDYEPKILSDKQIDSLQKLGKAISKVIISKRKIFRQSISLKHFQFLIILFVF